MQQRCPARGSPMDTRAGTDMSTAMGAGPAPVPRTSSPRWPPATGVRAGILTLLAEEPRNGYQIIQELAERSGGMWRPSPGSIYPALQQLEDEGLIRAEQTGGRKAYKLTDAGREFVAERDED